MKLGKYGKINRKFKSQWIKALLGGEFKQTDGYLKRSSGYCCLGVACKISKAGNFDSRYAYCLPNTTSSYNDDVAMPKVLRAKIKLTNRAQERLAAKNDNGETFEQIASWIRKYL